MVVVAEDAGDFPGAVLVLPEVDEPAFADTFGIFVAGVMEAVDAHLDRAIAFHMKDLQCAGHEFSSDLAANIFPYAVGESGLAQC